MDRQELRSQQGEIEFRKKLVRQQVYKEQVFKDEFDSAGIEKILAGRMRATFDQMSRLKSSGIPLSPYLEIGAERGQRSLVMENDLGAKGAAIDISFDTLQSCKYYSGRFNKTKVPLRVCCDAYSLPFLSGSLPFVFCFETLHHFPDPGGITKEIHRVLAPGGNFFFAEEPYKKILHFDLYEGTKMYSEEGLRRSTFRRALDWFFARQQCNESEHGILENDDITIAAWRKALSFFYKKDVHLHSPLVSSELFSPRSPWFYFLAYLLGGFVSGLCSKYGTLSGPFRPVNEAFICPECSLKGEEMLLNTKGDSYSCHRCGCFFPTRDGVVFLFSKKKMSELYQECSC